MGMLDTEYSNLLSRSRHFQAHDGFGSDGSVKVVGDNCDLCLAVSISGYMRL